VVGHVIIAVITVQRNGCKSVYFVCGLPMPLDLSLLPEIKQMLSLNLKQAAFDRGGAAQTA
jgi:hypothetical protein